MSELPEDIVSLVLNEVYYLNKPGRPLEHTPNRIVLRSCALVNSVWSRPAQALLFRSVTFTPRFVKAFLEEDMDESRRSLLQHVRIATTLPWDAGYDIDDLGKTIARCIEHCTALYELGIYAGGPVSFSDDVMDRLSQVSQSRPAPLRSLRIHECGVQSRVVQQLVSTFPSIEFLWINCEVGLPPKVGLDCKAQLYELRLTRNLRIEFFQWLLQCSQGSLQVLELRDLPGRATRDTLRPYCHTVRSLRLMPFNQISAEVVAMCTNLEELLLMGIPNIFPLPKVLPATLHHLEIVLVTVITLRTRLAQVTDVVKGHAPLRLLSLRGPAEGIADFEELEAACREHDVVLDVDDGGVWPVRVVIYRLKSCWLTLCQVEASVKTRTFPRRRSVSNFNLMN
jgi:hypothetical protein